MKVELWHQVDVLEDILPNLSSDEMKTLAEEVTYEMPSYKLIEVVMDRCDAVEVLDNISEDDILDYVKNRMGYTISEEI